MRAIRGDEVLGAEFQLVRKDGRKIWVRIDAAPVLDEDGQVVGGIAAFHDIDSQRALAMENARLYEAAQQANRAKDDFFATVSHELRTPMTSIIGWARLLRMEELESPDAIEAVDAIASSAQLQAQLIDDLLDLTRGLELYEASKGDRPDLANNLRYFPSRIDGIRSPFLNLWDVSIVKQVPISGRVRGDSVGFRDREHFVHPLVDLGDLGHPTILVDATPQPVRVEHRAACIRDVIGRVQHAAPVQFVTVTRFGELVVGRSADDRSLQHGE